MSKGTDLDCTDAVENRAFAFVADDCFKDTAMHVKDDWRDPLKLDERWQDSLMALCPRYKDEIEKIQATSYGQLLLAVKEIG